MMWKKLWPWAKKAVDVEFKLNLDLHRDLKLALLSINNGYVNEALEHLADFVRDDNSKEQHPEVKALLESVEFSLRTAASEYEMSFK